MRNSLFEHMQALPIRYFDTHAHGDIMSVYTNDIDTLRQMISQSIPQLINSAITVVSVFIFMLILNVPLTILTLVMVGITTFVTKTFAGHSSRYFVAQQKDIGKVNGFIEEMLNGQNVVKVFTHEEENMKNFNELNDQLFDFFFCFLVSFHVDCLLLFGPCPYCPLIVPHPFAFVNNFLI